MYRDAEQREFTRHLRKHMTEAELRLWRLLRAQQLEGWRCRRQAAIGPYIVDFICFSRRLIIELDGPQHAEAASVEHDARRTAWLTGEGFTFLRFWNHELDEDVRLVVAKIAQALEVENLNVAPPPSPALPTKGEGAGGFNLIS
jgi:very-short-patch-repair endonuclease